MDGLQLVTPPTDEARARIAGHTAECMNAMYRGPHVCICGAARAPEQTVEPPDPRDSMTPPTIMTDLPLPPGAFMTPDHRYYFNREGPVPSVTTVLDIMSKPALMTYKAKEAAKAMLQLAMQQPDWVEDAWGQGPSSNSQRDLILQALKEGDKARDQAASLGSSVHLLADIAGNAPGAPETALEGFQVSDEVIPYLEAYRDFLARYSASAIVSSEHMVWSANGYAGTYDLIMQIPKDPDALLVGALDTELWLIDIKTAKSGPYPEWGLQLAGYRWADSIILPGDPNPYPMPEIQKTGVLHLRPCL